MNNFKSYVLSFYAPGEIYGDYFNHTLTEAEVSEAIAERLKMETLSFYGDSADREIVRDIMIKNREALIDSTKS